MPLKNYTTEVPAMKSISQIQQNLVAHGAASIMVSYGPDRQPESMSFLVPTSQGDIPFQLPANVKAVSELLLKQLTSSTYRQWDQRYQEQRRQKMLEQASRTAWRVIKDWIDAQLAIIETNMVTLEQVFLPYMQIKDGRTLYQLMVDRRFLLQEGKE